MFTSVFWLRLKMRSCDWSDKDDVNLKASVTDFIWFCYIALILDLRALIVCV